MQRVFISYSRKDRTFVERLHAALVERCERVWVDWKDIPLTAEFLTEILRAIEASDNFLFVISPESVTSRICQIELDHACRLGKRIFPVIRREVDATTVPVRLAELNWVFMRDTDDFFGATTGLIAAIETDFEWVRYHTVLTMRASEWHHANREPSRLMRGIALREAHREIARWADTPPALTDLQSQFVAASGLGATRRRWLALTTVFILFIAIAFGSLLYLHQRDQAYSRQLAATAEIESALDPELGLLLAMEAIRLAPTTEAESALRMTLREHHEVGRVRLNELGLECLTLSPDRRWLVGGGAGRVYLWDAETLLPVCEPLEAKERSDFTYVTWCRISADRTLIAAKLNQKIVIWRTSDRVALELPELEADAINDLQLSPNGEWIGTGSSRSICLWTFSESRVVKVWEYLSPSYNTLAFSPDSRCLAAGFESGDVAAWDVGEGNSILFPKQHDVSISALAFDSTSVRLVTGSNDGKVVIWDLTKGVSENGFRVGNGPVEAFAVGKANEPFLVLSKTDDLWAVNPAGSEPRMIILGRGVPTKLAASPDGRNALYASQQSLTFLQRDSDGWRNVVVQGHDKLLTSMEFSSDGNMSLTSGDQHLAQLWDANSGENFLSLRGHRGFVQKALFLPDGRIATTAWDRTLRIWRRPEEPKRIPHDTDHLLTDKEGRMGLFSFDGRSELRNLSTGIVVGRFPGKGLAISADGSLAAFLHSDAGIVDVRECSNGKLRFSTSSGSDSKFILPSCSFSPDGTRLLMWIVGNKPFTIWDARDGRQVYRGDNPIEGMSNSLFTESPKRLLACMGNEVHVYTWEEPKLLKRLLADTDTYALAWESNLGLVAAGCDDNSVRIWNLDSGACISILRDHIDTPLALAFSPDGKWLATGGDYFIHVYSTSDWRRMVTLRGHTAEVVGLHFSKDSRFLASSGLDDMGRVWAIASGRLVSAFPGPMWAVRFSADQRHLIGVGRSESAHWRVCEEAAPADRLIELGNLRLRRELTQEEQNTYLPHVRDN